MGSLTFKTQHTYLTSLPKTVFAVTIDAFPEGLFYQVLFKKFAISFIQRSQAQKRWG